METFLYTNLNYSARINDRNKVSNLMKDIEKKIRELEEHAKMIKADRVIGVPPRSIMGFGQ